MRLVVDEDGDVVASYDADEFGNPTVVSESGASTDQRWVGGLGYRDEVSQTGLYYLRQRYYDAGLGRFLSQDPIGFESDLNLYAYSGNSPVIYVDPEGMKFVYDPSLKGNTQKAKDWINFLKTTPSPIQNAVCALDADPRPITIRASQPSRP